MPCATKKKKDGTKYAGCWNEKGGKTKSTNPIVITGSAPMSARQRLIAGLNPMESPVARSPGYNQARSNLISGGDVMDEYTSARANLIGTGSPFIMGYGGIPQFSGSPGYGSQGSQPRIDTGGPHRVGANMTGMSAFYPPPKPKSQPKPKPKPQPEPEPQLQLKKSSGAEQRGVYTEKWDKKNPPRHLAKAGQVVIFNNDKIKKYVTMTKTKALSMVQKSMSAAVYNKFKQRLTDKTHSTYVDWELHTSNKKLQKLFGI
tara:strand:- start:86 stop:862 length:777 start_codon:yes stop_codon:yes gene_type:complete